MTFRLHFHLQGGRIGTPAGMGSREAEGSVRAASCWSAPVRPRSDVRERGGHSCRSAGSCIGSSSALHVEREALGMPVFMCRSSRGPARLTPSASRSPRALAPADHVGMRCAMDTAVRVAPTTGRAPRPILGGVIVMPCLVALISGKTAAGPGDRWRLESRHVTARWAGDEGQRG